MRITRALGLVLVATFALPASVTPTSAAEAVSPSFVGEWTAMAETPGGKVAETVIVVKAGDGYAITAKLVVPDPSGNPEAGPGTDIVLKGNEFTYKRTVTVAGGSLVITYSGVVSGDTFTGTADLGFVKVAYNGVRISHGK